MRDRLVGLLDKADLALASCGGVVSADDLAPVALTVDSVRYRISYPDDLLVAALAGGTGSGKSSLFNAIVGSELADVGGVRPTTGEPLAAVNQRRAGAVDGYLTSIGVGRRRVADLPDWLCLIDLPDTDSVEVDHRLTVEVLLPRLDVVVWVVDPEKYRDSAFHDRYIKELASYGSQFVFVLNQADRLASSDLQAVGADFASALSDDGIDRATIVISSANPPAGPVRGVDDLVASLERMVGERPGVYDKLLVDLELAAIALLDRTGGAPVGFDAEAPRVTEQAVDAVLTGDSSRAIDSVTAFLSGIESLVSGPTAHGVNEVIAIVPSTMSRLAREVAGVEATGGWWRRKERRGAIDEKRHDLVRAGLADELFEPVRTALQARAEANAALTELALAVAGARRV